MGLIDKKIQQALEPMLMELEKLLVKKNEENQKLMLIKIDELKEMVEYIIKKEVECQMKKLNS